MDTHTFQKLIENNFIAGDVILRIDLENSENPDKKAVEFLEPSSEPGIVQDELQQEPEEEINRDVNPVREEVQLPLINPVVEEGPLLLADPVTEAHLSPVNPTAEEVQLKPINPVTEAAQLLSASTFQHPEPDQVNLVPKHAGDNIQVGSEVGVEKTEKEATPDRPKLQLPGIGPSAFKKPIKKSLEPTDTKDINRDDLNQARRTGSCASTSEQTLANYETLPLIDSGDTTQEGQPGEVNPEANPTRIKLSFVLCRAPFSNSSDSNSRSPPEHIELEAASPESQYPGEQHQKVEADHENRDQKVDQVQPPEPEAAQAPVQRDYISYPLPDSDSTNRVSTSEQLVSKEVSHDATYAEGCNQGDLRSGCETENVDQAQLSLRQPDDPSSCSFDQSGYQEGSEQELFQTSPHSESKTSEPQQNLSEDSASKTEYRSSPMDVGEDKIQKWIAAVSHETQYLRQADDCSSFPSSPYPEQGIPMDIDEIITQEGTASSSHDDSVKKPLSKELLYLHNVTKDQLSPEDIEEEIVAIELACSLREAEIREQKQLAQYDLVASEGQIISNIGGSQYIASSDCQPSCSGLQNISDPASTLLNASGRENPVPKYYYTEGSEEDESNTDSPVNVDDSTYPTEEDRLPDNPFVSLIQGREQSTTSGSSPERTIKEAKRRIEKK